MRANDVYPAATRVQAMADGDGLRQWRSFFSPKKSRYGSVTRFGSCLMSSSSKHSLE